MKKALENKALSGSTLTLKIQEDLNQQKCVNYFIFNRQHGVQKWLMTFLGLPNNLLKMPNNFYYCVLVLNLHKAKEN
ncbi:hypothetical protein ACE01N_06515 [Saccharicrinis sp. FJH2]|uniref:hypothetical protein n=1 Tax=Saccharicrinis sp. FJH65 TaxID=3344659 RepID=UPI0035F49A38